MQYLRNSANNQKAAASNSRTYRNIYPFEDRSRDRILGEAHLICDKLRDFGYRLRKKVRQPIWTITGSSCRYELHYLPRPVAEWTLLPNDGSPIRDRLMLLVEQALASKLSRGGGR